MREVSEITEKLEQLAPQGAACEWDNPGLLVGRADQSVQRIYVALDASAQAVEEAIEQGCDLIVTHHPIIFRGIKAINDQSALGIKLMDLIRHDVAVFSMHTNFDACPGGMADIVCAALGLHKTGCMERIPYAPEEKTERRESAASEDAAAYGIGFTAELPSYMTASELAALVKERFRLPFVQFYDAGLPIRTIACCPGSGRGELKEVLRLHADAFLSGDMGHHEGLDLGEEGISLIDAGHYGLEHVFVHYMAERLHRDFPELEVLEEPLRFPAQLV